MSEAAIGNQRRAVGGLQLAALIAVVNAVGTLVSLFVSSDSTQALPRDGTGLVIGRDFLNFWLYGRAAFEANPGQYYDVPHYAELIDGLVGGAYPWQAWSYPPTIMLLAAPFRALDYLPALGVWTGLSVGVFVAAARCWRDDETFLVAATLSPAAIFGIVSGQFHLLIAASLLTAFRLLDRRPLVAGLLIGLLTLKPQVGLFIPILLIVTGRFRVFGAAAATALALVGATTAIWGVDVWRAYIGTGLPAQMLVLRDPLLQSGPFMPTLFINLRFVGLGFDAAMVLQGLATIGAAGAIARHFWRRRRSLDARDLVVFFALSLIGSGYLNAYDTLPLAVAALLVMAEGVGSTERLVLLAAYLLPPIQIVLGLHRIPGSVLVPIALVAAMWRRDRDPNGDLTGNERPQPGTAD